MGLNIGPLAAKQRFESVYGQLLYFINHFAAPIISFVGQAFGVFIGEYGTHRFHHLTTHEILACDELNAVLLAVKFELDEVKDLGIALHVAAKIRPTFWQP